MSGLGGGHGPLRDYDGVYAGPIPLKDAIAYSKNAATVRLLKDVGIDAWYAAQSRALAFPRT